MNLQLSSLRYSRVNSINPTSSSNFRHYHSSKLVTIRSSLPFSPQKAKYYKELEAAVNVVHKACRICVDVQKSLFSDDKGVLEKNDSTPVTIADFSVQALISLELKNQFPSIPLVAEEDSAFLRSNNLAGAVVNVVKDSTSIAYEQLTDEEVLGAIDRGGSDAVAFEPKSATYWVLDPIDGTRGFLKGGGALYVVGLALVVEGEMVLGVMGCPDWKENSVNKSPTDIQECQKNESALGIIMAAHVGCAPGTGVVSSAILESDDLDEIDWEWLGGEPANVQTNYFGKGNTTTHDREADAAVTDTQGTTHNYTIHWTSDSTSWLVDDKVVRTLQFADANGGSNYPQTPMNVRIGIWAGGDPNNAEGTIEWAGGETDYSKAPYTMVLEKVEVRNENPGSSYSYGDMTGGFESIVTDGRGSNAKKSDTEEGTKSSSASGSATASASGSASPSATVNVAGGVGGEWASAISNSTGASTTASMATSASATGSATGSAAAAENTNSGAMTSKSLGGSLLVLISAAMVML